MSTVLATLLLIAGLWGLVRGVKERTYNALHDIPQREDW